MRAALELGLPVFLIRDTNLKGEVVEGKGPRRRVDRVEFLEDNPISRNLVFTFSFGGRGAYLLPEDQEGSCFLARETTKTKGCLSRQSALAMTHQLMLSAKKKWRKLNGQNRLPEIIQGVEFRDGIKHEVKAA